MRLDEARCAVLVDMAYELGGAGLAGFTRFLSALRAEDWEQAGVELKNSKLYSQVPHREAHNLQIVLSGQLSSVCPTPQALIRLHEGLTLVASPDAKGKWAIGWGHGIDPPASGSLSCTLNEAEAWFEHDFTIAQARARAAIGPDHWFEGENTL